CHYGSSVDAFVDAQQRPPNSPKLIIECGPEGRMRSPVLRSDTRMEHQHAESRDGEDFFLNDRMDGEHADIWRELLKQGFTFAGVNVVNAVNRRSLVIFRKIPLERSQKFFGHSAVGRALEKKPIEAECQLIQYFQKPEASRPLPKVLSEPRAGFLNNHKTLDWIMSGKPIRLGVVSPNVVEYIKSLHEYEQSVLLLAPSCQPRSVMAPPACAQASSRHFDMNRELQTRHFWPALSPAPNRIR